MTKLLFALLPVIICQQASAQTLAQLTSDMQEIASDATQGKFTGSAGYLKAAKFVATQLENAGLRPGWKENGKETYLQPVPFTWDDYSGSTLFMMGKAYAHAPENFVVLDRGNARRGKWVVMAPGDTVNGTPSGIILLPDSVQAANWKTTVLRNYRFGYMHYLPDGKAPVARYPTVLVSPALAKRLSPGDSVDVALRWARQKKTGYNVLALLPGSAGDKEKKAIVISAHLDHIGRIGNTIYNGANDDGSGCVAALSAARALAAHPCSRTILFALFCGEELNLKGSRWFMDHPPVPASRLMLDINLEQLGSMHRSFNGVWALGDQQFEKAFRHSANDFPPGDIQFSSTDSVRDILSNTDTFSFISRDIPSLLLGSGGFEEHHTPADKINLIDFPHLLKATRLLENLTRTIANQ